MIKQDYILRVIEQLARTLHHLAGLTQQRDFPAALQALDEAFTQFFGWDSSFVNSVPETYLVEMLRTGDHLKVDDILVLAVLLKAEGELYSEMGEQARAYHRHLRALHLFLTVHESKNSPMLGAEWTQTDAVLESLSDFELPATTTRRVWRYFWSDGQFAAAEDLLWQLAPETEPDLLNEGLTFYQDLQRKSDAELETGGLTRQEVGEGLREIEALATTMARPR